MPKDFGDKKLTWTIVANGQPTSVTFHMQRDYNLNYYKDEANGNEPPSLRFALNAPMVKGPQAGIVTTLTGAVGQPVALKTWGQDPPPLVLQKAPRSRQFRGVGRGAEGQPEGAVDRALRVARPLAVDPDPALQREARHALQSITGQTYPLQPPQTNPAGPKQ